MHLGNSYLRGPCLRFLVKKNKWRWVIFTRQLMDWKRATPVSHAVNMLALIALRSLWTDDARKSFWPHWRRLVYAINSLQWWPVVSDLWRKTIGGWPTLPVQSYKNQTALTCSFSSFLRHQWLRQLHSHGLSHPGSPAAGTPTSQPQQTTLCISFVRSELHWITFNCDMFQQTSFLSEMNWRKLLLVPICWGRDYPGIHDAI